MHIKKYILFLKKKAIAMMQLKKICLYIFDSKKFLLLFNISLLVKELYSNFVISFQLSIKNKPEKIC